MNQEGEYKHEPTQAVTDYIDALKDSDAMPYDLHTDAAAEKLSGLEDMGNRRDALGVLLDMSADQNLVSNITPALADMLVGQHEAVPEAWRNDHSLRLLVTMAAHLDLGVVQAQRLHTEHSGHFEDLEEKAGRLEDLINKLQEKTSPSLHEGSDQIG